MLGYERSKSSPGKGYLLKRSEIEPNALDTVLLLTVAIGIVTLIGSWFSLAQL
jgi:hypothetical protein